MHRFIQDHRKSILKSTAIGTKLFYGVISLLFWSCSGDTYVHPEKKNIKEVVFASGHIETKEQYTLVSAVDGYIEVSQIEEGMFLEHNTVLAEISQEAQQAQLNDALAGYNDARNELDPNSPKIKELDLKINLAKKELANNEKTLGSYEKLIKINAISKFDYDQQKLKTESARKDLLVLEDSKKDLLSTLNLNLLNASNQVTIRQDDVQKYHLKAIGKSQVLKRYRREGEYIRRGEVLAEMGKGEPIVKLFVEEGDINSIETGQTVELSINTYDGALFTGEIAKIYPAFDETQQSFIVEAKLVDMPKKLFPGTQVQANILTAEKEAALIVQTKSLVSGDSIYVKDRGPVKVELGIKNGEWAEVLSGVSLDDLILAEPKG